MTAEQERKINEQIARERPRLEHFIRSRVPDPADAEDILQEAFYELFEAVRLLKPIEQVGAWLFQVARNRIIDLFRRKKTQDLDRRGALEDLLPSPDAGPEAAFARGVLVEQLEAALAELPEEQRAVFLAHEIDGRSFKEISAATGVGVNTLLSRKHAAVLHLRERLRDIREEFMRAKP
jgi:RNA polymerase sigma factor (sigma-70 family)